MIRAASPELVALELGQFGITVNAVCPGFVETQLLEGLINIVGGMRNQNREQVIQSSVSQIPMGRMETGEGVADVVAFLA
jgi:NAD(P)-dependent dehydrogenase (short-subunit alcohol dehydrogenase family)